MKKLIVLFFFVVVYATLVFTAAFAQSDDEPVVIIPYLDPSPITIYSNQEVILGARWGACTSGLTRPISSTAILEWTIDTVPVFSSQREVKQYWGAPSYEESSEVRSCMSGDTTFIWIRHWRYSIGTLDPGVYNIRLHYSLSHPLIDGVDYDDDGRPDIFSGSLVDEPVTVIVVEPPA